MKKEHRKIIDEFEKNARPVDMTNFIMLSEILNTLKEIKREMKKYGWNSDD